MPTLRRIANCALSMNRAMTISSRHRSSYQSASLRHYGALYLRPYRTHEYLGVMPRPNVVARSAPELDHASLHRSRRTPLAANRARCLDPRPPSSRPAIGSIAASSRVLLGHALTWPPLLQRSTPSSRHQSLPLFRIHPSLFLLLRRTDSAGVDYRE
jgi:hypothetical protein